MTELTYKENQRFLNYYLFFSYLVILSLCSRYLTHIQVSGILAVFFSAAVYITYSLIYLLPAIILTKGISFLLLRKSGAKIKWKIYFAYFIPIFFTTITSIIIFIDQNIFKLFGFHLNGFVLNIFITPGGIEALGASQSMYATSVLIFVFFIILHSISFIVIKKIFLKKIRTTSKKPLKIYRYLIATFILLAMSQSVIYGIAHLQANRAILAAANVFPLYQPTTFRSLAKKMGYKIQREIDLSGVEKSFRLSYPLRPLRIEKPENPPNIVWLVAESWRWDMLTKEIMPNAWNFSQKAYRFTNCYSGGNGTRMSIFSIFYGLYGPYWFSFLNERRSPVIMDILQQQDYQIECFTSAKFSYPEFDKTVFAKIPKEFLHEFDHGDGWERDRKNVKDLIDVIKKRDKSRPFMTFMFFESPHARYHFPEESIIRENYLEDFNYASMNVKENIQLIFNRYVNACHHLDSQYGRIFDFLKQENLLKNTIVIITGDHGEEFMEKGRWGHNSEFHEEQTRVPLIMYIPKSGKGVMDRMASHLDITPTILPLLGVQNDPSDYSFGYNLFGTTKREYTVLSDWDSIGITTDKHKARFPLRSFLMFQTKVTTKNDRPVEDIEYFYETHQDILKEMMQSLNKFGYKQ